MVLINKERMVPELDGDFILFVFGIRINKLWMPHKWLPVVRAFDRMLRELNSQPQKGLMHYDYWGGNPRVTIQYWHSYDALISYARDKASKDFPAWFNFNDKISSSGAVGLWHETYWIKPGSFEAVYKNMPAIGLGCAGGLKSRDGPKIQID